MYAMVATQADIVHTIGVVSRFMANLGKAHWEVMKSFMRYFKGKKVVSMLGEGFIGITRIL